MEYWSDEVMEYWKRLHHSTTPLLQYSITPLRRLPLQLVTEALLMPMRPHSLAAFMLGDLGFSSLFQ
jgi:hypothetical protein